ncbi:MAG TPA: type IV toxin-antitoxin system AbiEi family antitoxin domain-containing protein, partial [Candidatus Babeliaceae bacterium]|nr:type IV toxin-antitoxin system AbiEi family antitoxin domain-containing protein [Candidatus Babeliaceae bacterium]
MDSLFLYPSGSRALKKLQSILEAQIMTDIVIYIASNVLISYIESRKNNGLCHLNDLEYSVKHKLPIIKGIGKRYREMLSEVLLKSRGYVDLDLVCNTLNIPRPLARTYLSRLAKNGWLKRIKRGIYVPVDLTLKDLSLPMEDPWIVAHALFSPCYIGGWTAAQHWDFTEQIFNDTYVFTSRKLSHAKQKIGLHTFIVKKVATKEMFGLQPIWKENRKILISDPHKTIIDILSHPSCAGGIRSALDFLESYLRSPHKNLDLL